MKLLLIRHGETVDNVAGLYAGVRDSALTNHGVDQASRLGDYLAKNCPKVTHIFASPLSRAFKTATAVQKAQCKLLAAAAVPDEIEIVKVADLIEQDFGYYEGKPFYARSDSKRSGREVHYDQHKDDPGFMDVESKESMCKRADTFLDEHLLPLFDHDTTSSELTVIVVSHGILLSNLWRRLLLRLPRKSLTIAPEVTAAKDNIVLEHLGGWSNTGYLELSIRKEDAQKDVSSTVGETSNEGLLVPQSMETPVPPFDKASAAKVILDASDSLATEVDTKTFQTPRSLAGCNTTISAVDSKAHLIGLKRQRGGIGRLAHDEGQKKLEGFFKKQRKS